jgi:predicted RNase H-like HicB family nuclease
MKYLVVIEKAERNYAAYVPDLPGCVATAPTLDELKQNVRAAVVRHLEGLRRMACWSRSRRRKPSL